MMSKKKRNMRRNPMARWGLAGLCAACAVLAFAGVASAQVVAPRVENVIIPPNVDPFDLSFDEIAPIVGRSEAAARQLASRARRRVRGMSSAPDADATRRREAVSAFLAASREGNFDTLVELLDPEVCLRADDARFELPHEDPAE